MGFRTTETRHGTGVAGIRLTACPRRRGDRIEGCLLRCTSPFLARLGHADSHQICPVLKVDRPCHRATACQSRLCDVDFPQRLMDLLPYKPISYVPKLANRTPFAFVVDSFLVRAADYSVGHRDR